jgi:hypothetical protein
VPVAIGPHTPFAPDPFFAAEQASQSPAQAVLQQTPSTHAPDWQKSAFVQAAPFGWSTPQTPPTHTFPAAQSAFAAHVV